MLNRCSGLASKQIETDPVAGLHLQPRFTAEEARLAATSWARTRERQAPLAAVAHHAEHSHQEQ